MGLRIEVLGPLRVRGEEEIDLQRSSHRRLLSILVLNANRRIGTDTLIDRNWGDDVPATAKAALQTHVSALRKLLPAEVIVTEAYGYRFDLEGHELDADEFDRLATRARHAARSRDWETALTAADAALSLWRGDPYSELADDEFARAEIARLSERRVDLEQLRFEALLGFGRNVDLLPEVERLLVDHPTRERLWEILMTALYREGRHADALEAYANARSALDELGLEPSRGLRRLQQKILVHDETLAAGISEHNLPIELTSFVGRSAERAEVAALLADHRLVTLTGVGGTGKTRLASRIAAGSLDAFPDGCWFVELAPLRDPYLVPLELAGVLGLRPHADDAVRVIGRAIEGDTTLILLDNCEHLVAAAGELARALLEAGPGIKVIATSREPLRVPGEVLYEVPPMPVPPEGVIDPSELLRCDSVQLFVERAAMARPSFALDGGSAGAVARVCRRLDGIPLAIELAAGRIGSLSADGIADHLDDRFRILTDGPPTGPERHRTLLAALDWSYDLLDAAEQLVFARLGLFQGGFTLSAAAQVCAGTGIDAADVVSLVTRLVDKSLVSTYETDSTRRYGLLETVREYANLRLQETPDAASARSRHVSWCAQLAAQVAAGVHGPGRWELFEVLDADVENLEAALEAANGYGSDVEVEVLARALAWDALNKGQLDRGAAYLRTGLERAPEANAEAQSRSLLGTTLFLAGQGDEAFAESGRAVMLAAPLAPSAAKVSIRTAYALLHLLLVDRDPDAAISLCEDALDDARATGDPFAMLYALRSLARARVWNGDADRGLEHFDAALDVARSTGDPAFLLETYQSSFALLYLHPAARRSEPKRIADEMLARFPLDDAAWSRHISWDDWLPYVYCQSGEWDLAEAALDRVSGRRLEGWDRIGYLVMHATLRWMQGRLDEARHDLDELEARSVDTRWYHDYYPLLADVSADQGRLTATREAEEAYLGVDVHPSEEASKLGVISPLVRAEIDAALTTCDELRDDHVDRARAAVKRGHEILRAHPPRAEGSLQMETPATHLALAEAELSRAVAPDAALWEDAVARADYVYYRLYARMRHAEALLVTGREDEASGALCAAYVDATALGADGLRSKLESLGATAGVDLAASRAERRVAQGAIRGAGHRATRRVRPSRRR